ncbi:MAG TPA: hypothetical protein VHX14_25345 [Thermoanaerobaculia bacterium]|nr:hypothetical protein [Thermoanaerobaculia bacterium]
MTKTDGAMPSVFICCVRGRIAYVKSFDRETFERELRRINELALWDYEISAAGDGTLLILGSNDFVYYHYLEIEFGHVTFCDLPAHFSHAEFRLGNSDEQATIWVTAESWSEDGRKEHEIRASEIAVRIGRVYYYERENLQPGERIASRKTRG